MLGAIRASRGRAFLTEAVALEVLSAFAKLLRANQLARGDYQKARGEFLSDYPGISKWFR